MNVLSALRRWWRVALLVASLVMTATLLFLLVAPRSYTASAVVAVVPNEDSSPSGDLVRLAVPTYATLATSESLSQSMATEYGEDRTHLNSAITAEVAPSTNTVVVFVRWDDPGRAAVIANGVVEELVTFSEQDPILRAFIVAPAVPPATPSFPPPEATIVVGAIAAIALGTFAALGQQLRRRAEPADRRE